MDNLSKEFRYRKVSYIMTKMLHPSNKCAGALDIMLGLTITITHININYMVTRLTKNT